MDFHETLDDSLYGCETPDDSPHVLIVEQPAKCGVRFRYECEGRISGAIPGANSTTLCPTFPTIRVIGYKGRAKVVVSCVTKNPPFRAHPHNLVGKKSCKDGVCSLVFEDSICAFNNLGILCAKRKDIRERLRVREAMRVDPFGTGFGHRSQAFKIIDLAVVRLCFHVFIANAITGRLDTPLAAVVSEPIFDKKAMSELAIAKLSHYSAPVSGGQEIILLCDRVVKDDIQIRFYEEREERVVWEALAEFKANDIHKHFAISFRSPKYSDVTVTNAVSVNVQLVRPSDGGSSESLPFYLLPKVVDISPPKRPRLLRPTHDLMHAPSNEYILPRLLSRADAPEVDGSGYDFIDFDINCIQLEENCNQFGDHFWPSDDHKDALIPAPVYSVGGVVGEGVEQPCVQLLDISDSGRQWSGVCV